MSEKTTKKELEGYLVYKTVETSFSQDFDSSLQMIPTRSVSPMKNNRFNELLS
jgi:hypothetical protein